MNSMLECDNCAYNGKHTVTVIKNKVPVKVEFQVSIFDEDESTPGIKMLLINTQNEQESYTSVVSRKMYDTLKEQQELIINYNDFLPQIQLLLNDVSDGKVTIKLKVDPVVQLGFYTMSQLKELTVLTIPFEITNTEEIIMYFKRKMLVLKDMNIFIRNQNAELENQLTEMNKKLKDKQADLQSCFEKNNEMSAKLAEVQNEVCVYKDLSTKMEIEKNNATIDYDQIQKQFIEQKHTMFELKSDISTLQLGMKYYAEKYHVLKTLTLEKVKACVPLEKYDKLHNMFSNAVADLIKSKVHLNKLFSMHDMRQSENRNLKDELSRCISTIKELEKQLSATEKITSEKQQQQYEDILLDTKLQNLEKMIEHIKLKDAKIDKINLRLNKKIDFELLDMAVCDQF